MLYLSHITDATVDAFATCGCNVRMRKYASCGPRLNVSSMNSFRTYIIINRMTCKVYYGNTLKIIEISICRWKCKTKHFNTKHVMWFENM